MKESIDRRRFLLTLLGAGVAGAGLVSLRPTMNSARTQMVSVKLNTEAWLLHTAGDSITPDIHVAVMEQLKSVRD